MYLVMTSNEKVLKRGGDGFWSNGYFCLTAYGERGEEEREGERGEPWSRRGRKV